ncbi:secretin receptor-like isoform X2 [Rhodnius prolixus]|uniref:secretin receptor-like isoform X2 n=1 Tax=Rhodnius prolixus TaxID=13249 RepID=UPI003D18CDFE
MDIKPIPLSKDEQDKLLDSLRSECILKNDTILYPDGCPTIWDGILCWPNTPSNTLASLPCPEYFKGFPSHRNATKYCQSNGTWYFDYSLNQTWTDYTACMENDPEEDLLPPKSNIMYLEKYLPTLKIISQIGYSVSLISLIFAFILLASFKKLRCPRNVLHMHLFVSFIMRAGIKLLRDTVFFSGLGFHYEIRALIEYASNYSYSNDLPDNWICKFVTGLWQYCIVANYSWILMEGLYLHNLIFLALFSDTSAITVYVLLGWGLPLLFVVPWVIVRAVYENTLCWTVNNNPYYFWIIRAPIASSVVLNFILFINIVRVLMLKLTVSISEEKKRYRRWAKSTLLLVPLFGVHYALLIGMSSSMNKNQYVEMVWLFCEQLFASFQGFVIAVLYCFMNGEVRTEISKLSWNKRSPQYFQNQYSVTDRPISSFFRLAKRQKRGSTAESCMTSFMSSVPTDLNVRRPTLPKTVTNSHLVNEIKADSCLLNKGPTICSGMQEIN